LVVGAGGGLDLNNIAIYRMSANTPPNAPERVCTYHSKDGSTSYADPTFSPRGDALAFAAGRARQARGRRLRVEPEEGLHGHGEADRPRRGRS